MELTPDVVFAASFVFGAGLFLVRRFTSKRQPPSCAPDAKVAPPVIIGSKLAKAMSNARDRKLH